MPPRRTLLATLCGSRRTPSQDHTGVWLSAGIPLRLALAADTLTQP